MATGLEEVSVKTICRKLPVVTLVIGAASMRHMFRIQTATVMATVPDHLLIAQWQFVQDTVNEPICGILRAVETHLSDSFCR